MDKQNILSLVKDGLANGTISQEELLSLTGVPFPQAPSYTPEAPKEEASKNLIHVFYGIGAVIAVVGVGVLVAQNWDALGFLGRIFVTLGIGLITYIVGLVMNSQENRVLSQVMFTVSSVLYPFGSIVFLNEINMNPTWTVQLLIASILFVLYAVAFFVTRRNILVLLMVGFATWMYYVVLGQVFGDYMIDTTYILRWAVMLLGTSYILLAFGLERAFLPIDTADENEKKRVRGVLYMLGTLGVLGMGITVGGVFDIIFIAFIFAAFYGSVFLKSRAMLVLGALFLIGHIIKLTSEYFVDSIGWPIALILIGFLIIGVGYLTVYLNKSYIKNK